MVRIVPAIVTENNRIIVQIKRSFEQFKLVEDEKYVVDIRLLRKVDNLTYESFMRETQDNLIKLCLDI